MAFINSATLLYNSEPQRHAYFYATLGESRLEAVFGQREGASDCSEEDVFRQPNKKDAGAEIAKCNSRSAS